MVIKPGEYIRTIDGYIGKFIRYSKRKNDEDTFYLFVSIPALKKSKLKCKASYIKKHNKNIIKVLKIGDYVDGYKIEDITKSYVECNDGGIDFEQNDIETVMTKEQYERYSYKLKD